MTITVDLQGQLTTCSADRVPVINSKHKPSALPVRKNETAADCTPNAPGAYEYVDSVAQLSIEVSPSVYHFCVTKCLYTLSEFRLTVTCFFIHPFRKFMGARID